MNQNQNYDALLDDNLPPATMHDSSPHARATPISAIIGDNNNTYQNNYHNHNNNNEYIEYPIEPGSTGDPTRRGPISDNMYHESSRSPQRPQRQKSKQEKLDEFAEIARKLEEAPLDHAEAMRSRYEMPYQVAVAILIVATMVLFVYSNRSLGAGVKLTVTPIVNIDNNNNVNTDDTTTYYYYNSKQNMISIFESLLDISKEYPIIKNFNVITNSNSNSNKQDISASEMLSYMAVSEIDNLFNLNSHSNNDNNNSSDIIGMSIDDLPTYSATVFTFTLVSSIEDFVNADAWALAIVIAGFSGIWPYIKLISLLWIWMLPVSANKRDWGLLFLDQFGKFSFVDLFVTMFMVVSFYVRITEQLETVGVSLGITVEPDIGLMTFVLGTLLSMAWTHIFIYLDAKNHRSIKVNGKRRRRYSSILVIAPSRYPLEMPDNMQDIDYYDNDQTRNDNNKNKNKKNNKNNNKNRQGNETAPSVAHSRADTNSTDLTSIQYPQSVKNNVYYYNNDNNNNNNNDNNYYNNNNNNDFDAMSQITDIETENAVLFHHFPQKGSKLHQWQNSHEYNNRSKYQIFALYHTPKSFIGIFFRSLFLVSIIANIYLLITVIITAPVKYTLDGIIAKFIDNPIRAYSVLEVANMLPHKTDQIEYAYMLQVVYYVSAIITPVIVAVLIVFVWLLPSTWYMHKFILHIILPIQAWAALDVFFIGSLAASLELEQVSEWIINSNFAGVCGPHGTIENIVHMGCFSVKGELTIGTWLMLISVTFLWFSLVYTVRSVKLAHNELGINQRLMKKMIWKQKQLEKEYSKHKNEINQYNNLIHSSNYPNNNNNNNNKAYHRNMDAQSDMNTAYGSDDQYAM